MKMAFVSKILFKPAPNKPMVHKLETAIQLGLLVLVTLMPFHAFLSVWLGHLTGHQALIQAWKEVLLVILAVLGAILVAVSPAHRDRLRNLPIILGGVFAAIALLVTVFSRPPFTATIFGAKTDLEFLVAFILAAVVSTPRFIRCLSLAIMISAGLVIGFGMLQFTLLPQDFLARFGYGPGTVAPYLILDPAVKSVRFASTLGGPNQLGTYLMLPLALFAVKAFRRRWWWTLLPIAGGALVILHTYSRSAWLGTLAADIIVILGLSPARLRLLITAALALLGVAGAFITERLLGYGGNLQYYLLHSSSLWHGTRGSDYQHLASLQEGLTNSLHSPLGHGLGTAGPATFHAANNFIIENNYLQIAYETGIAGAVAFIAFIISVLLELARLARHNDLALAGLAAIIGISVTALVLPAWTDSTTALVVWTAAGSLIGLSPGQETDV